MFKGLSIPNNYAKSTNLIYYDVTKEANSQFG